MRFLVIGSGFGEQHLLWLDECPDHEPVLLGYHRNAARAHALARRFSIGVVDDLLSVISSGEVDAVAVASPPGMHEESVLAALDAGLAVVSDKPLTTDVASAERLVERARSAGAVTAVTFQWRANPALRELRSIVLSGHLGDVLHVDLEAQHDFLAGPTTAWPWRHRWETASAGALADQGVHLFDQLQWLVPGNWSVTAGAAVVAFDQRSSIDGTVECHTEDVAEVLLASDHSQARVFVSRVSAGHRVVRVRVLGTRGQATVSASPDDGSAVLDTILDGVANGGTRFGPSSMNPYAALFGLDGSSTADFAAGLTAQVLLDDALRLGCGKPLRTTGRRTGRDREHLKT
ncbi:Gfo/Idh/MocA family protein [Pseudonocardia sp. TMWB2A]|uniref:Gfo/Idh/MocA family protein n=1 Tax=Pseudonocardia sp. TMWB2A TaxID=687430 RepID=UPI00307F4D4F